MVVSKDMPEEQAYEIVKAILNTRTELEQVYTGASWTTPENTLEFAIAPLHPGVVSLLPKSG